MSDLLIGTFLTGFVFSWPLTWRRGTWGYRPPGDYRLLMRPIDGVKKNVVATKAETSGLP